MTQVGLLCVLCYLALCHSQYSDVPCLGPIDQKRPPETDLLTEPYMPHVYDRYHMEAAKMAHFDCRLYRGFESDPECDSYCRDRCDMFMRPRTRAVCDNSQMKVVYCYCCDPNMVGPEINSGSDKSS